MNIELLQLLILIIIANGAPIVMRVLLNQHFNTAVDFGHKLPDKQPVLGESKTWRGIFSALIVTSIAAWSLGYPLITGFQVAIYAVFGDLISSFIKRRLGRKPSTMALFIDQVPESLFPALVMMEDFNLDYPDVIVLVLIFIITERLLSLVLYKVGIRRRPY